MKSNHPRKHQQINIIVPFLIRCYKKNNKYSYSPQCVYKNNHKNYIYTKKTFKNIKINSSLYLYLLYLLKQNKKYLQIDKKTFIRKKRNGDYHQSSTR